MSESAPAAVWWLGELSQIVISVIGAVGTALCALIWKQLRDFMQTYRWELRRDHIEHEIFADALEIDREALRRRAHEMGLPSNGSGR